MTAGIAAQIADIRRFAGPRLWGVLALAAAAAVAEGAGLLLLLPLLRLVGLAPDAAAASAPVDGARLAAALALYVALVVAAALIVRARTMAASRLRQDFADDLRRRAHRALLDMPWRAFSRLRGADSLHTLNTDALRSAYGVEMLLMAAALATEAIALLGVATYLSPLATLAALALAGAMLPVARRLDANARALGQETGHAQRALAATLNDDVAGFRTIKSLAAGGMRREALDRHATRVSALNLAFVDASSRAHVTALAAAAVAIVALLGFTTALLDLPLAETLVLAATMARVFPVLVRARTNWRQAVFNLPAYEAMKSLAAAAPEPPDPPPAQPQAQVARPLVSGVELRDVKFDYGDGAGPALDGVSMRFAAGRITALKGPSGAGKSTLADILAGLMAPASGEILIDGVPCDAKAWRTRVGYVPQDAFLFNDSVRANLLLAAPRASEADLRRALDTAAADFVDTLPQGLETVVGDRGARLSGGQRQRLCLARALLREPDFLILDEATGALDDATEAAIFAALRARFGRTTVLAITHRASTAGRADATLDLARAGRQDGLPAG